jgi:uncharacterized protein (DUF934 family)
MPRRLLRDGQVVVDEWQYLGESEHQEGAALIIPFAQWLDSRDSWLARGGRLGVVLAAAHSVESVAQDLGVLALVGAEFTGPGEGRGYSQARLLRERWQFSGELRATGYVRQDQLFFMARCGFNAFELPDSELASAGAALATFSAAYQPSTDIGVRLRRRQG